MIIVSVIGIICIIWGLLIIKYPGFIPGFKNSDAQKNDNFKTIKNCSAAYIITGIVIFSGCGAADYFEKYILLQVIFYLCLAFVIVFTFLQRNNLKR